MTKVLGRIKRISELQTFQNTDFTKKDLILIGNDNTPYKFEFHKEKTDLLNGAKIGQDVVVEFKIRGNEYDKKDSKGKPTGTTDISNPLVAYKINLL